MKLSTMREINPKETTRAYAFELWMKAPMPMVTFFKILDVSRLVKISKKSGMKFNMLMCWCIGKAASSIKEFYMLPVGDKLMQYDAIAVNTIDEATSSLVIYPIYGVRFDILSKWFEKFSMKNLQDQRDGASIDFSGDMLSMQDKFYFNLNGEKYATDFNELQAKVQKCAEYVFSEYSSLDKLYNKTILPILNGEVSLPDVGADWIFIDLALCKIVNPSNFHKLKQIILSHVRKMYMCKEPNILYYYDNLEDILQHLEYTQL